MGEMTLERACEVLTDRGYMGVPWRAAVGKAFGMIGEDVAWSELDEWTAVAVAQRYERDSAPPADARAGEAEAGEALDSIIGTLESAIEREGVRFVSYVAQGTEEAERGLIYPDDVREARRQLRALLAAAERGAKPQAGAFGLTTPLPIGGFLDLVRDMRAAQKRYFRERMPAALEESKALERRVDAAIREAGDDQGKLDFGA